MGVAVPAPMSAPAVPWYEAPIGSSAPLPEILEPVPLDPVPVPIKAVVRKPMSAPLAPLPKHVVRIHSWFRSNRSLWAMTRALNRLGYPTPREGVTHWTQFMVKKLLIQYPIGRRGRWPKPLDT